VPEPVEGKARRFDKLSDRSAKSQKPTALVQSSEFRVQKKLLTDGVWCCIFAANQNLYAMKNTTFEKQEFHFISELKDIVKSSRHFAYNSINLAQLRQNWLIGQKLVIQEQGGNNRAEYGKHVIEIASRALTAEYGKGFSERNLWKFKQFYLTFKNLQILPTSSAESTALLSWSHYERLLRVKDSNVRKWYEEEATKQMWSYRTLDRNINTLYFHRMLSSQTKNIVEQEMQSNTSVLQNDRLSFIKNPAVLEFLGLPENKGYTESDLEQAIINHMQNFLLELGKGFSFVARQQLIRTDTSEFYIDLVFYNYLLNCFVIIELKNHAITHQDIGQLDMYVRLYDDLKKGEHDNPTIGILLCTETDKTIARYSVLNDNKQLFASQYMNYLPSEEELTQVIEQQREIFLLQKKL
jgi:predicted nuclease of restriction endonuclease-like (RecB) superfamily